MREYMRWRRLQRPASLLLDRARRRARDFHLVFSLDRADIFIPVECPALGIPIRVGGPRSEGSPSLDRIVPELGYVPGNVRVISDKANRLKGKRTLSQLRELAVAGPAEWREDYRKLVAYVDRENLLQEVRLRTAQPGRAGKEWKKIANFLDRLFSRGLIGAGEANSEVPSRDESTKNIYLAENDNENALFVIRSSPKKVSNQT